MSATHINLEHYIKPSFEIFDTFEEFKSNEESSSHLFPSSISVDDIIKNNFLFVVGDPGNGKSRFLKEASEKLKISQNFQVVIVDLKILNDKKQELESLENKNSLFIAFDGLDEVPSDVFLSTLKWIFKFQSNFRNSKIFISCRTNHLLRHSDFLHKFDFKVLRIIPFNLPQVSEYLIKTCPNLSEYSEVEISQKLYKKSLWRRLSQTNVLSVPRYLNLFAQLINEKGESKFSNYSRSELFEELISFRLKSEEEKKGNINQGFKRKLPYVKLVLERLALIMEIHRSNNISKENFITFLFDTNLNLDSQLLLEIFYDGTILKDFGDYLEFDNTEFQEYLAAKGLLKLGDGSQVIVDLAIQENLKKFYPSWVEVLSFLVEEDPKYLFPLIQLGVQLEDPNIFYLLSFLHKKHINQISNQAGEIFSFVFRYHQERTLLIDYTVLSSLSQFYDPSVNSNFFNEQNKNDSFYWNIYNINRIQLLGILVSSRKGEIELEKGVWMEKLLEYATLPLNKYQFDLLQVSSIRTLGKLAENFGEIEPLIEKFGIVSNRVSEAILRTLEEVAPNHPKSIKVFLIDLFRGRISFPSVFHSISTKEGYLFFFNILLSDFLTLSNKHKSLKNIRKIRDSASYFQNEFFNKIEKIWDQEIEDIVVKVIAALYMPPNHHTLGFDSSLIELLKAKNPKILFDITKQLHSLNVGIAQNSLSFSYLIRHFLSEANIKEYIKYVKSELGNTELVENAILCHRDQSILSLYQTYFPSKFEQRKKRFQGFEELQDKRHWQTQFLEQKRIETFRDGLGKKQYNLIYEYAKDQDFYDERLTGSQRKKFENLVFDFLKVFDPVTEIMNNNEKAQKISYSFLGYETALLVANKLNLDIQEIRKKIIQFIPFSKSNSPLAAIGSFQNSEEDILWDIYSDPRNDGLIVFNFSTFSEICAKMRFSSAKPLIKRIIEDQSINYQKRKEAFEILWNWEKDVKNAKEIFSRIENQDTSETKFLLAVINKKLLQLGDSESFDWIIKQLIINKYATFEDLNSTGVKSSNSEPRFGKGLGRNLKGLRGLSLKSKFFELLESSFKVLELGPEYRHYVKFEIWDWVFQYFDSLKYEKCDLKSIIQDLKNILKANESISQIHWFQSHIERLNSSYLTHFSEINSFPDSIKMYNHLKSKSYLDIKNCGDLFQLVKEVVSIDLRFWIENLGGNNLVKKIPSQSRETYIQKLIVPILENFLFKKGIRHTDIFVPSFQFYREVQNPNDERVDIVINYGAVGSVLLELKREYNPDLKAINRIEYRKKFRRYMVGTNCEYALMVIIGDDETRSDISTFESFIKEIETDYKQDWNIEIIGLDCQIDKWKMQSK